MDWEKALKEASHKIAKWALEKQIPKRPINMGNYEICPTCKELIVAARNHIFCGHCGQGLDRGPARRNPMDSVHTVPIPIGNPLPKWGKP